MGKSPGARARRQLRLAPSIHSSSFTNDHHPPPTPNKTVRIVSMTARRVMLPLKIKVEHASHVRRESENVIVECRLSDGTVGWGEGVPREYVTGETCDRSIEILRSAIGVC